MKSLMTGLCFAALVAALPASAQDNGTDDDAFDDALKNYGYAAGAAVQCADEAEKPALVEDVRHVFTRLVQLFGTDSAFFFSAAFGAGTVDVIEPGACESYTAAFTEGLAGAGMEGDQ